MKSAATNHWRNRAFTLVEMTGVLAVVAVLTAMLVPKIFETINTGRINAASASINAVKNAVANHYATHGGFTDSAGEILTPASAEASADAGHFDSAVLLGAGMLERPFAVKIGDQLNTNLVRIRKVIEAPDAAAITPSSANYDMDGVDPDVDTNDGALICECVITGVSAGDAHSLKTLLDGSDPTALANLPAAGAAATKGRVKYDAIAAGATGTVLVYINHM